MNIKALLLSQESCIHILYNTHKVEMNILTNFDICMKVTEEQMPSIMQLVPECLSSTPDLVAGTYLILSLLATRTTLAKMPLEHIFHHLTKVCTLMS